jgi:hypothetical protein
MRTTLTIDDDVAFGLKKVQEQAPEKSFKEVVNDILRQGLGNSAPTRKKKKFKVTAYPLGLRNDIDFSNIEEALDIIEGPNRR